MNFPQYMAANFLGLTLQPALFYAWTAALRFELNVECTEPYDSSHVLLRAKTLYKAVFRPGDLGFIVALSAHFQTHKSPITKWRRGRFRGMFQDIFRISRRYGLGLSGVAGRCHSILEREPQADLVATLRWAEVRPLTVDYEAIFRILANARYNLHRAHTDDSIYFVNRTRNIIFYMYDDRGLDIIAAEKETLESIYAEHYAWLLKYDLERMSKTFAQVAP